MLYVAVGENANSANSQSLSNRLGKILRINSDGSIPANPTTFPGIAGSTSGLNQAIWAVGLRNPFTFTFNPSSGRMFINDVGQSTWEEIDDGIAGSNYGWAICEGFCAPPNANFRDPLFEYGHGSSATTAARLPAALSIIQPPLTSRVTTLASIFTPSSALVGFAALIRAQEQTPPSLQEFPAPSI